MQLSRNSRNLNTMPIAVYLEPDQGQSGLQGPITVTRTYMRAANQYRGQTWWRMLRDDRKYCVALKNHKFTDMVRISIQRAGACTNTFTTRLQSTVSNQCLCFGTPWAYITVIFWWMPVQHIHFSTFSAEKGRSKWLTRSDHHRIVRSSPSKAHLSA
jgi:hypothetical protein